MKKSKHIYDNKNYINESFKNFVRNFSFISKCKFVKCDFSESYFKELKEFSIKHNFNHLSMGMSHDYLTALDFSSSFLRLGTCIFGERKS